MNRALFNSIGSCLPLVVLAAVACNQTPSASPPLATSTPTTSSDTSSVASARPEGDGGAKARSSLETREASSAEAGAKAPERRLFESAGLGVSFRYPSETLTLKQEGQSVELDSGFWVDEPHGLADPGQDTKQHFRGSVAVRDSDVEGCIRQDSTFVHDTVFKNGVFGEQAGFAEKRSFGGRAAVVILTGAHGYNRRRYYLSLAPKRTVVVSFDIVGDVVQTRKKGLSEPKQIAVAEEVAGSIAPLATTK